MWKLLNGIVLIRDIVVCVDNLRIGIDSYVQLLRLANFVDGALVNLKYLGIGLLILMGARSLLHLVE